MYVYMCVSVCTRVYMDFVVHDYAYYTKTYSSYLKCFLKEKYISLESQNYGLLYTYMLHIYTNIYTHTYIYIYMYWGADGRMEEAVSYHGAFTAVNAFSTRALSPPRG